MLSLHDALPISVSLADSPAFSGLLDDLRDLFDLVVLDTPPVLPVDDSRVISAQADGVVLLVRWRRTPAKAAELALRQLDERSEEHTSELQSLMRILYADFRLEIQTKTQR